MLFLNHLFYEVFSKTKRLLFTITFFIRGVRIPQCQINHVEKYLFVILLVVFLGVGARQMLVYFIHSTHCEILMNNHLQFFNCITFALHVNHLGTVFCERSDTSLLLFRFRYHRFVLGVCRHFVILQLFFPTSGNEHVFLVRTNCSLDVSFILDQEVNQLWGCIKIVCCKAISLF